ncbi:MAG: metallophosphoesterase family protein [Ignavibacteriales bacterium]
MIKAAYDRYKVGVISDIHGNIEALNAVLADGEKNGVNEWICTGDLVNYGPRPSEVIDTVRRTISVCVIGNRDFEVVSGATESDIVIPGGRDPEVEKAAFRWTRERLGEEERRYLESLPRFAVKMVGSVGIALLHATPWSLYEYLPVSDIGYASQRLIEHTQAQVYCFGHTHVPYTVWQSGRVFVNAGSCGRPKDGDPRPCYVLITVSTDGPSNSFSVRSIEIVRVAYDVDSTVRDMVRMALPGPLSESLKRGA